LLPNATGKIVGGIKQYEMRTIVIKMINKIRIVVEIITTVGEKNEVAPMLHVNAISHRKACDGRGRGRVICTLHDEAASALG
jgi:hypothetical protein